MSYDINFWKLARPLDKLPGEVYGKLCEGETVDGLETLPIDEIYTRIGAAFSDFNPDDGFIALDDCGIEVSSSTQHVRFDIRGEMGASINTLVDIMADFGCPMYDPQVNERYDKNNGLEIGAVARFEDLTDEERQAQEHLMQNMLAQLEGKPKKGCGPVSLALLSLIGSALWLAW